MKKNATRIINRQKGGNKTLLVVAASTAVIAFAALYTTLLVVPAVKKKSVVFGCETDADCQKGHLCAAGGCIILIPSEARGLWQEDVAAQFDAKAVFKPVNAYGEKLIVPGTCPASSGKIKRPKYKKLHVLSDITVYEMSADKVRIYRQAKVKGDVWIDTLRFWLGDQPSIDPASICASSEVRHVSTGKVQRNGKKAVYVDAALRQSVPAGAVASASVSAQRDPGPIGPGGLNVFEFTLDKAFSGETRTRTAVVLPLGSDLTSIEGPSPNYQRLLRGFVAYYWKHGVFPSRIVLRYRIPPELQAKVDITELNP